MGHTHEAALVSQAQPSSSFTPQHSHGGRRDGAKQSIDLFREEGARVEERYAAEAKRGCLDSATV